MRVLVTVLAVSFSFLLAEAAQAKTTMSWAHADYRGKIYNKADGQVKKHGKKRLWYLTSDGFPEVYRVLAGQTAVDSKGRHWQKIVLPARPNHQKGWVLRDNLGTIYSSRLLLTVNRKYKRARLYRYSHSGSRLIWSAPVGVGKPSTPTPAGRFWIRERIRNLGGKGLYGPLAFGTAAYSRLSDWPGGGVIGIHGTNQPWLLPGAVSHGCIRLRNRDVLALGRLLKIGTPVLVK